ncbi:hypothetical protein IG631_19783 [Alternaria alternata]|nr:hypothetical protein IG631_19783 [Alternaria alternata]
MRLFAWIQATFHIFDVVNASTSVAWSNLTSQGLEFSQADRDNLDCAHNHYCNFNEDQSAHEWISGCPGLPRITEELWRRHRHVDAKFLRKHFRTYKRLQASKYKLASDELTFPAYMAKRYAPSVPPSSMLCDGLGMCRVSILLRLRSLRALMALLVPKLQ